MMKAALVLVVFLVFACAPQIQAAINNTSSVQSSAAPALSEAQQQAIKRIKVAGARKAALPALRLAGIIRRIYQNMLADKTDEKLRARLSAEMKETTWQLLAIKGQTIRETVNVLTREQKQYLKSEMKKPGAPADLGELIERVFKLEGGK
jgi:hypothetical protein